jgi:hypothetical protein
MDQITEWVKTCLHKTKLSNGRADQIISKAAKGEGKDGRRTILYKYFCPHCSHWHVTRKPNGNDVK